MLQCTVLVCWPLTSPHLHASWVCRTGATGIWTVHLIRSAYVWESEAKDQAAYIDDLLHSLAEGRKTIPEVRKALKDGQTADSVLNHMLKNTMADAPGCIDLYCHARPHGEDVDLLSKASGASSEGCGGANCAKRCWGWSPDNTHQSRFAEDFVRGRDVEFECPLHVVWLDPMACNVILVNTVTNAARHGCRTNPEVQLTMRVSQQSHNAQVKPADDAATHPGRPPGSAVQPVRGRRTTASPSVPRVRAPTVYGETHQFPESRGLSAGLVFLSVRSPAHGGPCLVRAPLFFAPCMVLSAPPHLGPIPSKVRPTSSHKAGACRRDWCF